MREKGRRPLDAVALGWRLHRRARVDTGARPRLADVPHRIAGLERGVELRWSAAHVPFVEARSAPDAAVGLGVAHAHLRLFQIDVMRRLAAGRLAEILGRPAVPFDRMLRIVGFARPVPAIAAALAPATRRWLAGFVDGLNAVVDQAEPPPEYRALDLRPTGWTVDDVLTVGRLAASDFSWQVWRDLAPLVGESGWPAVWERLLGELVDEPRDEFVDALDRGGSNAAAVAAGRSATGGALFTCDPHLTIMLPNAFLAAGVRCPELEATGLMVPGLPVFAVGRNRRIAWGGTSLHAASSDLVDVGGLAAARIDERRERIAVRGAGDAAVTVRETPFGPIVSDAPILGLDPRRPVALRWIGHRPNDEIAALLDIARADDWPAFQAALTGYASPAVTMLYADDRGRIGRATAAHLPRRPPTPRPDLVVRPEDSVGWRKPWRAGDLPAAVDPPDGLIASANDRPAAGGPRVGLFFAPRDRVVRLETLLRQSDALTPDDLARSHLDVRNPRAATLARRLAALLAGADDDALARALRDWDGSYATDSAGALAFEAFVAGLVRALHGRRTAQVLLASWDVDGLVRRDLDRLEPERLRAAARRARRGAARALRRHRSWGAIHRLALHHPFARVPGLQRRFRFVDRPVAGGRETLMKTAHPPTLRPHRARKGAVARFLTDMSDLDGARFVLLGGQDGWPGSATFLDQHAPWSEGRLLHLPLSRGSVERHYPHHMRLTAATPPAGAR